MTGSVRHRALDGSELVLKAMGVLDLSRPASSVQRWMVDGHEWEFTSGPLAFGPAFAADFKIALEHDYSMQGGVLSVGMGNNRIEDPEYGFHLTTAMTVGAWVGRQQSLVTHIPLDYTDMVELFARFRIAETPTGIVMASSSPGVRPSTTDDVTVMKEIPRLGLVITHAMTDAAADRLPGWAGIPTTNGESYCDEGEDGVPIFRVVSHRSFSLVLPDPQEFRGASHEALHRATHALADRLAGLNVDWEAARTTTSQSFR